jgi:hypothetical protein
VSAVQPGCYFRCGRKAAVGRLFCSARCAAEWAEQMAIGNEDEWCTVCQDWHARTQEGLACGHVAAGLTVGHKHADAARKYTEAVEARSRQAVAAFTAAEGE